MTCTNCALGVEKYLKKEHASAVSVDFTSGAVLFELEKEAQLPRIIKGIEKLGYEVQRAETARPLQGWSNIEKLLAFSLVFTVPLLLHMFISWHPLHNPWVQLALATPVYLAGMYHFGRSAFHSLKAGVANMDVLVTIGATAAFGYSLYGTLTNAGPDFLFYETAASIISLVLLGNVMEHLAVKRTTSAVEALARLQPETARRISVHGDHEHIEQIEARQIVTGDLIQVNQGDRIPADGIITSGTGEADESMISGESVPRYRAEGEPLLGGSLLVSGNLRMKATATGKDSVLGSIIELVRKAQADKPQIQQLADKISAVFVPAVLAVSLLTFVLSLWAFDLGIGPSLIRSVAVLVIACPCAMGLATPTAVVVGIGRASQAGILIKGGRTLELFSQVKRVVFDKTGTLTTGAFRIAGVHSYGMEEADIQQIVVSLEKRSSHPVARSIQAAWAHITPAELAQVTEAPGLGMTGQDAAGHSYQLGSFRIAQGLGGG
ncbi:MAG: cation-translocating P-type ATPase, partial [Bacteroidetes bacterium]